MKSRIARHASLILVGAILLVVLPITTAWALDSVSSVSPNMLAPGTTRDLTMHGSFLLAPTFSFNPPTGIAINSAPQQSGSDYIINVTIAASAPTGDRDVIVKDALNPNGSTCSKCFTVTPPPKVTSIAPMTLAAGGGPITYTITGTGFLASPTVAISNNATNLVTVGTATMGGGGTTIAVPLTAASNTILGARDVTVTNTDGQSSKCVSCLTITPPPTAISLFPAQRAAGLSNQRIDVLGWGFNPTTTASFSGGKITSTTTFINSAHLQLTISVNSGAAPASVDVTFSNTDNGGHSVCTGCFAITGPTSIEITTPSTVNGSIVAKFSQPVSGVSSSNSFVRVTGTTSNLPTLVICVDQDGVVTNCATGYVKQAVLRPTSLIVPGQHYTVHIASGSPAIVDFGGLPVAESTKDFTGGVIQPGEGPATFLAWRAVRTSAAYGGSYVVDDVAGATASYRFTGSSIIWYTNIGPSYGIADLYIDGVKRAVVNSYSATTHYRAAFTVSGFSYAGHTLTVRVRGVKGNSHGTGTNVAIDAFSARGILVSTPSLSYVWGTVATSAALGSLYSWANEPGASASFTFRGTSIEWDTVTGPQMGLCKVYIDGVLKATINNYSPATTYNVKKTFTGLTDAVHSIRIIVSGTHQAASSGSFIVVDGWVVT